MMKPVTKIHRRHEAGFSLVEVLVSMVLLLVVAGIALTALSYSQKVYASQQMQVDMHAGLRSTFELLTQEIGQAGSLNFTPRTVSAAVTGSSTAQNVNFSSTDNIFVGEKIIVGTGSSQELVAVTAIHSTTQVSGIFKKNHATGAAVTAQGVFPQGVLSTSSATSLQIFGDLNADGKLTYVRYDCDTTAGTLSRSITTISPGVTTQNTPQVVLDDLVANPDGTPCFQYGSAVSVAVNSTTYTFLPSLAVSLTVRTSKIDPQSGSYTTMTKSFSNLASRNVLIGIALAQASPPVTSRLQPTPAGLPLSQ